MVTTDLSADLVRAAARACYGMDAAVDAVAGCNNPVFRIHIAGGVRFLKFAADGFIVHKEATLLALAGQHGIPVPAVEHGDPIGRLVGRPFLILASAGDRNVLQVLARARPRDSDPGPNLVEEMGSLLARIHRITLPGTGDFTLEGFHARDPESYRRRLNALARVAVAAGAISSRDANRFQELSLPDPGGNHLCHGDYHAVQCVEHSGRVSAVVDWESAWSGNPAIDLAISHAYCDFHDDSGVLTDRFLSGYGLLPPGYATVGPVVRMAHILSLWNIWNRRGLASNARRAAALFEGYARHL